MTDDLATVVPKGVTYSTAVCQTAAQLFEHHYEGLIQIARQKRRRGGSNQTLLTMDLVHESYLRLCRSEFANEDHFLASATLAVRHVLVDHARKKCADKRQVVASGERDGFLPGFSETPEDIIAIANLFEHMAKIRPRWVRVMDARYFAGMTEDETAAYLELSPRTVRREWKAAKAWLAEQL